MTKKPLPMKMMALKSDLSYFLMVALMNKCLRKCHLPLKNMGCKDVKLYIHNP